MALRVVQLGSERDIDEGLRIGTVRRPPRGVRKEDFARLNYFDLWLPQLAPSPELVKLAKHEVRGPEDWKRFERSYRRELSSPDNERLIGLLSAFSRQTNFSVGCYCEDESSCHRSILRQVLAEHGAEMK